MSQSKRKCLFCLNLIFLLICCRYTLYIVGESRPIATATTGQNITVDTTMAVSQVPTPPPPEMSSPVAENWCYTQVGNITH